MKRPELQSGGGFFLTLPPGDNHVWPIEGLPINKTDNSSLKRESITHALFSHHIEDTPPSNDANDIIADILSLSMWTIHHNCQRKMFF
jgi:hypothetical protein